MLVSSRGSFKGRITERYKRRDLNPQPVDYDPSALLRKNNNLLIVFSFFSHLDPSLDLSKLWMRSWGESFLDLKTTRRESTWSSATTLSSSSLKEKWCKWKQHQCLMPKHPSFQFYISETVSIHSVGWNEGVGHYLQLLQPAQFSSYLDLRCVR